MPTPVLTPERPPVSEAATEPARSGCGACPHPEADHDGISARYCRATVASALDRGCVCPTA